MKVEYYSEDKLKKEILNIIGKYIDISQYQIFFFGSRVKGDNFKHSDIDIGIEGPDRLPASIKLKIEEELENLPTLYKFDLVDFKNVTIGFRQKALKYAEYLE
jgi:predicted nucleotidyltransferase